MNKVSVLLVLFLTLTLTFGFAADARTSKKPGDTLPVRQAFMEKSPGAFNPAQYTQRQQEMFDWLMAEAASLTPESIMTVPVSSADLEGIENYQCETCGPGSAARKVRIGVAKPVGVTAAFDGMRRHTPDGGFAWTMALESPTATALRVHFTDFALGPDAEVYIYNMNGEAFGPYTGNGPGGANDFWSNTVTGTVAFVQLRQYGHAAPGANHFTIAEIGYLGEKFLMPFLQQKDTGAKGISTVLEHCSDNEPCVEDASCYSGGALGDAKYATAYMQWVSGPWIYMCSGGLIADTDTSTQIPYFLTANHCISKDRDAENLECYFQYWTASCHGACYDPVGVCPRTLGALIMDSSTDGDHTLMQLNETPPSGSVFLGWTNQPVANSDGTQLYRISHPSGMPQAYSKHEVDSGYIECSSLPVGEFIYSRDLVGATEGGSSGSPVFNGSGQIVGQLYGGCGYNINDVCDAEQNRTVDGAFAFYYNSVAPFLDPDPGTGGDDMHVDSIVLSFKQKGPNADVIAKVTIVDAAGAPVAGAVVSGTFSGDANGSASGTTDADGEATVKLNVPATISTFTFCVDNVVLTDWTYDSGANVETCDTY